jgi:hypothetical protein
MSPTEPWFAGRLRELSRDEGMASGWGCRCVEPWRPSIDDLPPRSAARDRGARVCDRSAVADAALHHGAPAASRMSRDMRYLPCWGRRWRPSRCSSEITEESPRHREERPVLNDTRPRTARAWSVDVLIDDHDGRTHAEARLHPGERTRDLGRRRRQVDSGALGQVDREPAALGPDEVRLHVDACGICRADLQLATGELQAEPPLVALGHEVVGQVVEVGDGVRVGHQVRTTTTTTSSPGYPPSGPHPSANRPADRRTRRPT